MTAFEHTGSARYSLQELAKLAGLNKTQLQRTISVGGRDWSTYWNEGVSWKVADRAAGRCGFHPAEVWPEWSTRAFEDHGRGCRECGEMFVPVRSNNWFCRAACREKWWGRESKRRAWARLDAERRERRLQQMRDYRRECAAALSVKRRARYAENADRERARERERYWRRKVAS